MLRRSESDGLSAGLAVVFGKNEKDDLSPMDRKAVAAIIKA
jgi:hypothetical protein